MGDPNQLQFACNIPSLEGPFLGIGSRDVHWGGQFEYIFDANNSFLIFAMFAVTIGMSQVNFTPITDLDC